MKKGIWRIAALILTLGMIFCSVLTAAKEAEIAADPADEMILSEEALQEEAAPQETEAQEAAFQEPGIEEAAPQESAQEAVLPESEIEEAAPQEPAEETVLPEPAAEETVLPEPAVEEAVLSKPAEEETVLPEPAEEVILPEPAAEEPVPGAPEEIVPEETEDDNTAPETPAAAEEVPAETESAEPVPETEAADELDLYALPFRAYSKMPNPVEAAPGESVTLKVLTNAPSGEKLTYKWTDYDPDQPAENKSTYTIKVKESKTVFCEVTNEAGENYSVYFAIQTNHLTVSTDLPSRIVAKNGSATMTVKVSADDKSNITYSWYENDNTNYTSTLIEGETSSSLKVTGLTETKTYFCRVEDGYNNIQFVNFNLIQNNFGASAKNNIQYFYLASGDSVTLETAVVGDNLKNVTYQWYEDNQLLKGKTSSSLKRTNLKESKQYHCTVSDGFGNQATVFFTVIIDNLSAVAAGTTSGFSTVYLKKNGSTTLKVEANAYKGTLTYQWTNDANETIAGATKNYLKIKNVKESTSYLCTVSDNYGNTCSVRFMVKVNELHAYVKGTKEAFTTYTVKPKANKKLQVKVVADDMSDITYEWSYNTREGYSYSFLGGSTFTMKNIQDPALVTCVVRDNYGNMEGVSFDIDINNNLKAYVSGTKKTGKAVQISKNESKTLKVKVSANDKTGIKYEWREYTINGPSRTLYGQNKNYIKVSNLSADTQYTCLVTDRFGNTASVVFNMITPSSLSTAEITLSDYGPAYTGKAIKPSEKVVLKGKTLKKGTDYKVTYYNNKRIGTATIVITGTGKYSGAARVNFHIIPKKTSISSLTAGSKSFTVKWKKQATQTAGYMIMYTTDKNFESNVEKVFIGNPKTVSHKVSGLKKGKTYYVMVAPYTIVGGSDAYYVGEWSAVKKVKTK